MSRKGFEVKINERQVSFDEVRPDLKKIGVKQILITKEHGVKIKMKSY